MTEIIKCEICSQDTVWERVTKDQPRETEHCTECDRNVCEDCFCWTTADEATSLCKDCCTCIKTEYNTHWLRQATRL